MLISDKRQELAQKCPYDFYADRYLSSNGITANVVVNDLDPNFQGQIFQFAILTSIGLTNPTITIANRKEAGYLPSYDLLFHSHEFSNVNI